MSKKKPYLPLFQRIIKLGLLFRCQNHRSQNSRALIQFRKLISERMKLQSQKRENEENKDRLSDLPDCVLLHILSFLNAKNAVRTCLLSKRWNHLWKHLPTLTLSSNHFKTLERFAEFVNQMLSLRDSSMAVNTLNYEGYGRVESLEPHLLERIVRYAVSHNVNHLHLYCRHLPHIPPSLFSCSSLTSLDIEVRSNLLGIFPNSMNLPALTYLKLYCFSFYTGNDGCVKPFSTFNRLDTLILRDCFVQGAQTLRISNTTLLNLSIRSRYDHANYLKVKLSAPNLCTFDFTGNLFHDLYGSSLSSIKQVSIDVYEYKYYSMKTGYRILKWLIKMPDIRSLTVCPRTLQALSLVPDILKVKLPFLFNLKSLKLDLSWDSYTYFVMTGMRIKLELVDGKSWKDDDKLQKKIKAVLQPDSSILDGMIDLLLQNSPSAKFDILLGS